MPPITPRPIRFAPPEPSARDRPAAHLIRAALAVLTRSAPDDPAADLILKGSSVPADTTTPAWAAALAQQAVGDFIASLAPESAGAKLMAAGLQIDLAGVASLTYPQRHGPPNAALGWVAQGGPIPVRKYSLDGVEIGPLHKLAAIVTMTTELARGASGEAVLAQLLREDAAATLDATMFGSLDASGPRPAGLRFGIAGLDPTPGAGDIAMLGDLDKLAGAVAATGATSVVYVASPAQAMAANLRTSHKATVWPSAGLPAGTIMAVAPQAFVSAVGADARIETATQATLHMEDTAPAAIGSPGTPTTVAAPAMSQWQTDTLGVRLLLDVAWGLRTPAAVAWLTDAAWGGTS